MLAEKKKETNIPFALHYTEIRHLPFNGCHIRFMCTIYYGKVLVFHYSPPYIWCPIDRRAKLCWLLHYRMHSCLWFLFMESIDRSAKYKSHHALHLFCHWNFEQKILHKRLWYSLLCRNVRSQSVKDGEIDENSSEWYRMQTTSPEPVYC